LGTWLWSYQSTNHHYPITNPPITTTQSPLTPITTTQSPLTPITNQEYESLIWFIGESCPAVGRFGGAFYCTGNKASSLCASGVVWRPLFWDNSQAIHWTQYQVFAKFNLVQGGVMHSFQTINRKQYLSKNSQL
jgi:hypothetical protein